MKLNINEVHFVAEMIKGSTVKVSEARGVLDMLDKFEAEFVKLQKQDSK